MNSHRHSNSNGITSHGSFRLFNFKSKTARILLNKSKLQQLQLASVHSILDDSENDQENEPPTKEVHETALNVPQALRFDGSNHWPAFISAVNNTR
ncbi:unnamed protein product, partial [Rotaria sordida]